jgi:hypothetical protein
LPRSVWTYGVAILVGVVLLQCSRQSSSGELRGAKAVTAKMQVTSAAFTAGGRIPSRYTCDGPNLSPPLSWTAVPEGTKSLALIMDDPDTPGRTWVHWVLYNLPSDTMSLPEHLPTDAQLANGASQGISDFGSHGYRGPCPPGGSHRYNFRLYAVDALLNISGRVTKQVLLDAMKDHVVGTGELMGTYERR